MTSIQPGDGLDYLVELPKRVKAHIMDTPDPGKRADLLGQINSTATALGRLKLWGQSEVADGEHGTRWRAVITREAKRTYATPRLLMRLQLEEEDLLHTLMRLLEADVITIGWKYSNLKTLANSMDLPLTVAYHPIGIDDAEHDIGEDWDDTKPSYKPIQQGEDE